MLDVVQPRQDQRRDSQHYDAILRQLWFRKTARDDFHSGADSYRGEAGVEGKQRQFKVEQSDVPELICENIELACNPPRHEKDDPQTASYERRRSASSA